MCTIVILPKRWSALCNQDNFKVYFKYAPFINVCIILQTLYIGKRCYVELQVTVHVYIISHTCLKGWLCYDVVITALYLILSPTLISHYSYLFYCDVNDNEYLLPTSQTIPALKLLINSITHNILDLKELCYTHFVSPYLEVYTPTAKAIIYSCYCFILVFHACILYL